MNGRNEENFRVTGHGRVLSVSKGGNQHKAIAGFWLYPVFQHDRRGDPLVVATVVGNQDGAGRQ